MTIANQKKTTTTSQSESPVSLTPQTAWTKWAVRLFVTGAVVGFLIYRFAPAPSFTAVEGVGIFAVIYVIAQASERLAELASPWMNNTKGLDKPAKGEQLRRAIAAEGQDPAPQQREFNQTTANRQGLFYGLTGAIGMVMCGLLHIDMLRIIGLAAPGGWLGWVFVGLGLVVTGVIVSGGSDALHGLITNLSKSSAQKDAQQLAGSTSASGA